MSQRWTPEMVGAHRGMEKMASVQQNRDMTHESEA